MNVTDRRILRTIVDEEAFVSILSSTTWQALGSPQLLPATNQILDFNHMPTVPLGILPQFPIALEGKTVCIDVMVVQDPLYFNLLLACVSLFPMKVIVSTLFKVMYFPHDGNIVTIDHLSFIKPDHCMTPSHQNSLNVPHVLVVPAPSPTMSISSKHRDEVQSFENLIFFSSSRSSRGMPPVRGKDTNF